MAPSFTKNYALTRINLDSPSIDKANVATYLGVYAHLWSTAPADTTTDYVSDTYTLKYCFLYRKLVIGSSGLSFLTQETFFTFLMTLTVASSFILGALISLHLRYPSRLKGDIAAFSAGIFLSTVSSILIDESIEVGSFTTMAIGFALGLITYSLSHKFLKKEMPLIQDAIRSVKNEIADEKKPIESKKGKQKEKEDIQTKKPGRGHGNSVIVGKLMDSIPKALFIGVIVALDLRGLLAAVISLFIGNITATIEGARRMSEEGKSRNQILKRWTYVFISVAVAGPIGYFLARPLDNEYLSIILGFAAGDVIAFIVEDLIPEAYKKNEWHIGISAGLGFLVGITIFHFL